MPRFSDQPSTNNKKTRDCVELFILGGGMGVEGGENEGFIPPYGFDM